LAVILTAGNRSNPQSSPATPPLELAPPDRPGPLGAPDPVGLRLPLHLVPSSNPPPFPPPRSPTPPLPSRRCPAAARGPFAAGDDRFRANNPADKPEGLPRAARELSRRKQLSRPKAAQLCRPCIRPRPQQPSDRSAPGAPPGGLRSGAPRPSRSPLRAPLHPPLQAEPPLEPPPLFSATAGPTPSRLRALSHCGWSPADHPRRRVRWRGHPPGRGT
jgi:hypothetical protein